MDQVGVPQGATELFTWNNFFRGQANGPPSALFYGGDLVGNYADAVAFAQAVQTAERAACNCTSTSSWLPLASRPGVVAGTPFLPSEIQPVGQKTDDAYAMLRFGQDEPIFGSVRLDGNIGVRYVRDKLTSSGSIGVPSQQALGITTPFSVRCAAVIPPPPAPQVPTVPGGICNIGPAAYAQLQTFATGETTPNTALNKYSYWLPSLNLKFGLTRDLIFRLAASRDFARPALADIRNFLTIGLDSNGLPQSSAGNPFLKPITSDNFDATLEWYFGGSRVGSLTVDVFMKNIHNYIFQSTIPRDITSNGVTETVLVRGPSNFNDTGKVKGFEISYTQTYDFLPGLLSGFGLNANYAYVKSKGVPNSFLNGGSAVNTPPVGAPTNLPLAQLSKHTINIEPFYEKGPVSVRLAYNWRSKFLLTESDVIFPYFPIFQKAYGTLDASAFYSITPSFKIGVQAQNLTNAVTKTLQQFTISRIAGCPVRRDAGPPVLVYHSRVVRRLGRGAAATAATFAAAAAGNADMPRWLGHRGDGDLSGPAASASASASRGGARARQLDNPSIGSPSHRGGAFCLPALARKSWRTQRLVMSKRVRRRSASAWKRQLRQALEIGDGRTAPPARLVLFTPQVRRNRLPALGIDIGANARPGPAHFAGLGHAPVIVLHQFVPKRPARAHSIGPRHMVEPQQIFVRYAREVTEAPRDLRRILQHRLAAAPGSVESDAVRVGAVVVTGIPARLLQVADPRPGPIMVLSGHLVRKTQRRHEIHRRFARFHHHRDDRPHRARIVAPR